MEMEVCNSPRTDPETARERLIEGIGQLFLPHAEKILALFEEHEAVVVPCFSGLGKSCNLVPMLERAAISLGFEATRKEGHEFWDLDAAAFDRVVDSLFAESDKRELLILDESLVKPEQIRPLYSCLKERNISLIELEVRYSQEARDDVALAYPAEAKHAGLACAAYRLPNIPLPEALAEEYLRAHRAPDEIVNAFVDNVALRNTRLFWRLAVEPAGESLLEDLEHLREYIEDNASFFLSQRLGGTKADLIESFKYLKFEPEYVEYWSEASKDYS